MAHFVLRYERTTATMNEKYNFARTTLHSHCCDRTSTSARTGPKPDVLSTAQEEVAELQHICDTRAPRVSRNKGEFADPDISMRRLARPIDSQKRQHGIWLSNYAIGIRRSVPRLALARGEASRQSINFRRFMPKPFLSLDPTLHQRCTLRKTRSQDGFNYRFYRVREEIAKLLTWLVPAAHLSVEHFLSPAFPTFLHGSPCGYGYNFSRGATLDTSPDEIPAALERGRNRGSSRKIFVIAEIIFRRERKGNERESDEKTAAS